ncbi:hypothetical protein [Microbispora triticiradicis]|uniref:Uncharacterized protein n=2 Tax=Microbispora TaxID=2005 RepID=A0ABY3M571_9ACTN|nr:MULTISPECIES: hypothetical protein [Microbispora]TLP66674.1 hypothetical protein FED44_04265 [Microbispora fusca]TYB67510.1 hypothetical protein FXF59_02810 [Microbispora tritici]
MTLVIANGSFILFATVGGILAMSYETVQTRYAIKEILPRLVVAFLATNASCRRARRAQSDVPAAERGNQFTASPTPDGRPSDGTRTTGAADRAPGRSHPGLRGLAREPRTT